MSNIYDILNKLKTVAGLDKPATPAEPKETVYESVEARGSITEAVKDLESKYETFKEGIEDRIEAAREKASAKGLTKEKETDKKSNVRKVKGSAYGGSKQKDDAEELDESSDGSFAYRLLGRLQADCDYFLGAGSRSERQLWAGNVADQIAKMKELWNSLPAEAKPEWLSMEDILDYEQKMAGEPELGEGRRESEYDANEWLGQRKVNEDDDDEWVHPRSRVNRAPFNTRWKQTVRDEIKPTPDGFGPEDEVLDHDLRADPSKPAYIKKVTEDESSTYVCVHVKKGKCEVQADSSYGAAKKAAQKWGLKSTAGIDCYLADKTHSPASLGESDEEHDQRDAYDVADPKHPDFADNYHLYKASNPGCSVADYISHLNKKSLNEGKLDDLRDAQAEKDAVAEPWEKSEKKQDTKRTVKGSSYGGSKQKDDAEELDEAKVDQVYTIEISRRGNTRTTSGTLPELIKAFSYTLEVGKSYEYERGNKKINMRPTNIKSLVNNLNNAKSNSAANGAPDTYYSVGNPATASNTDGIDEANSPKHSFGKMAGKPDARYTINKEFDGSPNARHVVRFAGDYVSGHDTPEEAEAAAQAHKTQRDTQLEGVEFGDAIKNSQAKMKKVPMKLKESRTMTTGVESVLSRFPHEVKQFEAGSELDDDLYNALFDYYFNNGEMPYGVAKARSGDPYQWVSEQLSRELGLGESIIDVHQANIPSPTNEVPVSKELDEIAALAGLARPVATAVATNVASSLIDETDDSSDVDTILSKVGTGELDAYDVMNNPQGPAQVEAAKVLNNKYNDISIDYRLHPDDQFEEIIDIMCNQLADDYPALAETESEFYRNPLGTNTVGETDDDFPPAPEEKNYVLEQGVEEADPRKRDIEYTNSPREKTAGVQAAIPSGTDQSRVKKQYRKEYPGDNHMAVKEDALWKSYQEMLSGIKK